MYLFPLGHVNFFQRRVRTVSLLCCAPDQLIVARPGPDPTYGASPVMSCASVPRFLDTLEYVSKIVMVVGAATFTR